MPDSFDIDNDEKAALIGLLREVIERDRFPLSPRVKRLRGILGKLGVGSVPAMLYAAPKPPGGRSSALARKPRGGREKPCKRRRENPSLKRPGSPVAPE
jgi:hypothetical protein